MSTKKYIRELAIKTLSIEAKAINRLLDHVDDDFCSCVEMISNCKGRVIVTGIGKSAIIAQKIVATFNSTGTSAFFMHAADAVHGDVGMIRGDDLVLILSKSGETPELKALVPLLNSLGHTIIALCSSKDSFLASNATRLIYAPVDGEADPNNLAPTASTIAQMAMGDALAISVLSQKGFSAEEFAKFHPGGSLGKQMYLKVGDLSKQHSIPKVHPEDSIKKVIVEITSHRLGAVVILDDDEKIKGIITDGDVRRMLERNGDIEQLKSRDIMSLTPKTIEEDTLAINALHLMRENSINQLVVTSGEHYKGLVHIHDIIREGLI